MPNAAQYREAAHRYRVLGENYLRLAATVSAWSVASHLGSGPVADAAVRALRGAASQLTSASSEMSRLARVCDGRAVVCDDHRLQIERYQRLDPLARTLVRPPSPPAPWVSL